MASTHDYLLFFTNMGKVHWRKVYDLPQLPRDSRVMIALQPANNWGWPEVLMNKATYLLEVLAWQNTKDAQKKAPSKTPRPYVPDFMKNAEETRKINRDSVAQDVDSIKAILAKPRT